MHGLDSSNLIPASIMVLTLNAKNKPVVQVGVDLPKSGFKAFYVDLKYKAPFGEDYIQSTRMYVLTDKQVLLKSN